MKTIKLVGAIDPLSFLNEEYNTYICKYSLDFFPGVKFKDATLTISREKFPGAKKFKFISTLGGCIDYYNKYSGRYRALYEYFQMDLREYTDPTGKTKVFYLWLKLENN